MFDRDFILRRQRERIGWAVITEDRRHPGFFRMIVDGVEVPTCEGRERVVELLEEIE